MFVGLYCTIHPEAHKQGFDGLFYVGSKVLTDLDPENRTCQCGAPVGFIDIENITDTDLIIAAIEGELESVNYHTMVNLPGALFTQFKVDFPVISEQDLTKFAHTIRKAIVNDLLHN